MITKLFDLNRVLLKWNYPINRAFHSSTVNMKNITARKLTGVFYTEQEKKGLSVSPFHFQALCGLLLGDLTMYKKASGDVNFKFEQGVSNTLYLLYLFYLFYDFVGTYPNLQERWDNRYGRPSYSWYFRTLTFPCFNEFYTLFFDEKG